MNIKMIRMPHCRGDPFPSPDYRNDVGADPRVRPHPPELCVRPMLSDVCPVVK